MGERSVTHGPPPPPDNGVRTGRELPKSAESATAPRLMPLGFIDFPYVAGCAALAVNAGLLKLQPLARLCVVCAVCGRCDATLVGAYGNTPGARREMKVPLAEIAEHAEEKNLINQINLCETHTPLQLGLA